MGPNTCKVLEEEGFDEKMGARPLQRLINEKVKMPPAKYPLEEDVSQKS